jgi:hypothetical protein
MKGLYLLMFVILLFSCQEENKYVVEDALYQCLVDEFETRGVDFDLEVSKLEEVLLREKVLASSLGEDYIQLNYLINNYSKENSEKIKINTARFKKLSTYFQNRIPREVCLSGIDSNVVKKSRFYLICLSGTLPVI